LLSAKMTQKKKLPSKYFEASWKILNQWPEKSEKARPAPHF
jgi:hypothetical protein